MASERKDAVEIRGCCSVACCPSAPQAEAISCFKIEEVLRCWRELVHEQCGEGEGDCDTDVDCAGNLKCGQGNGFNDNCDTSLGFLGDDDCCYDPRNQYG